MKERISILLALITLFILSSAFAGKLLAQPTPPADTPVITLTTSSVGASVRMKIWAAAANTPIWIETAPNTYETITAGASYTNWINYTPTGTSLKVYGNIIGFNCSGENTTNINPVSAIDASANTGLKYFSCSYNQLTNLNVQGLHLLENLWCQDNKLTDLNVQGLTQLKILRCSNNQLQNLDVQGLTQLKTFECSDNQFGTLDLDKIYCQLPERTNEDNAFIVVSSKTQSDLEDFIRATNRANANNKKWKIYSRFSDGKYEITNTTGNYECGSDSIEELIASGVNVWTLNGILHIDFKESVLSNRDVTIFDMSGKLVYSNATPTEELQIQLPSGVYIVKVGDISFKVLIFQ